MQPKQIVILLIAGAIAGAGIMNVVLHPRSAPPLVAVTSIEPDPMVAEQQAPSATAPLTPAPAEVAPVPVPAGGHATGTPADSARPSPLKPPKPPREAPKSRRLQARAVYHQPVVPVHPTAIHAATIQGPPPPDAPPVQAVPTPTPSEHAASVAQSVPPAPKEPEHVTPAPLPPAPPEPHRVTLNAGILIPVRLVDGLSSERNLPGDSFTATLDKELVADGFVIAERGARVEGRVVASDKGGKVKGVSSIQVELVRLSTSDRQSIPIQTDGFERRSEESRRQDAEKIGAGAALGAVIGAIAGGGKGAAIGAGIGGGAGAGTVMATRGGAATLPSETRVNFRLKAPVTITERLRG